jgi:signal peptidase II
MKFKNFIHSIPLMLILIGIDQVTKAYYILLLPTKKALTLKITSWLSFVYAWNHGISFGLFSEHKQYSNYAFLAINCLIVGYLSAVLNSSTNRLQSLGITFIIGGAIGNLIDRFYRGAVFDFIFFHYEKYSFPAFNLADAFIDIGVVIVIISFFKFNINRQK